MTRNPPGEDGKMLRVEQVSKAFYTQAGSVVQVLGSVTLTVRPGEIVSLLGPNGCGKTTLLRVCSGITRPDSGEVHVDRNGPTKAVIGYVPQNYRESLYPWLSNLDNIALPLRIQGIRRRERHARVRQMMKRFGIAVPLESFPYSCRTVYNNRFTCRLVILP